MGAVNGAPRVVRPAKAKSWPVVEVFGPTIQGEGPDAGRACWFVRLGGCDFRCSWCDSMHAVDPAQVREHATRMRAEDVVTRLRNLDVVDGVRPYVVLSGGNPALHQLEPLVRQLHDQLGATVSVETQGSVWRPWLEHVDRLVVSPKPPSSGMVTEKHAQQLDAFMDSVWEAGMRTQPLPAVLKVVVADEQDYRWAQTVHARWHWAPMYLSVCTPQGADLWREGIDREGVTEDDHARRAIGERYRWLCERTAGDRSMDGVKVLPQLHVIAWGTRQGV